MIYRLEVPDNICPDQFSVTTGRIILKFEDMVVVQEGFKIQNVGL